eukprot:6197068-Pleurochrysis_carterae.AAC.1
MALPGVLRSFESVLTGAASHIRLYTNRCNCCVVLRWRASSRGYPCKVIWHLQSQRSAEVLVIARDAVEAIFRMSRVRPSTSCNQSWSVLRVVL